MAPEYGATMGFFGVDEETLRYLRGTGRSESCAQPSRATIARRNCGAFRRKGQIDYSVDLALDLATVVPAVAGPKRPQDHINLRT
jgi:aconitate hydratase